MKKKAGNKIGLGVFVTVAITLFIAAIYFIGKGQQLFGSSFHVIGIFKDISGLQVGNNVRFSGINVGIIEDIKQISDSAVKVDMLIDEDARKFIKINAKAMIGSDGLMGNKLIQLIPGTNCDVVISNNDVVQTVSPVNIDDILLNILKATDNTANITGDLSVIAKNLREGKGTLGKLFMDSTFAENLDVALINIKEGAGGFKQNMDAASHNFLLKGYLNKKKKEKEKRN